MTLKTHKALSKRVIIKKSGKIIKRTAGQDHFNARESGKVRRNKRRDTQMPKTLAKAIKAMMPHAK